MNICGIGIQDIHITAYSKNSFPCLRPEGHGDPHLIQLENGRFVAHQIDYGCGCEDCLGENQDDWCCIYWDVAPSEAECLKKNMDTANI